MAVIRWDPFTALSRIDNEFDDLVRRTWGGTTPSGFVPSVDMVREGDDVLITLELPGVDISADVDIEVAPRRLSISGARSTSSVLLSMTLAACPKVMPDPSASNWAQSRSSTRPSGTSSRRMETGVSRSIP